MFQASIAFYPNQANPQRESGKGVYRVVACGEITAPLVATPRVDKLLPGRKILTMIVDRLLKPKSRVDPVRLALARLKATT